MKTDELTPKISQKEKVLTSVQGTKVNKSQALAEISDALAYISRGLIKNVYLF
jgi:hypothetical protein